MGLYRVHAGDRHALPPLRGSQDCVPGRQIARLLARPRPESNRFDVRLVDDRSLNRSSCPIKGSFFLCLTEVSSNVARISRMPPVHELRNIPTRPRGTGLQYLRCDSHKLDGVVSDQAVISPQCSSASSLFPISLAAMMKTPIPSISIYTPCSVACGASARVR